MQHSELMLVNTEAPPGGGNEFQSKARSQFPISGLFTFRAYTASYSKNLNLAASKVSISYCSKLFKDFRLFRFCWSFPHGKTLNFGV